ncbi:MAG: hypothetical protein AAGE84_17215 [Cyanobacteria bacterium P01_G01_bin.39]
MNSKVFVLIACRRTGSNYLMKILDSFPELEFFGEVYHWDTVWMPTDRKKEYVTWLKNTKNIEISIGENPYEDKELVKLNHNNPNHFLEFLSLTTKSNHAGFKVFPEHLPWPKLQANLLNSKEITKVILKRNFLDVYISDKILQQTKHSQGYNTSNIKIKVNCVDFKHWYYETQSYFSRIELYLKNDNQKYFELSYEDIHTYSNNDEKVDFIYSWFANNEFELNHKPKVAEYTKKQDQRSSSLVKVENAQELEKYLKINHLQHLIHN